MALFGEGIDGARAAELGLAWQAVDDNEVEGVAAALAARAAKDPELARRTARSMRAEWGPPALPWTGGAGAGARLSDVVDAPQGHRGRRLSL